MSLAVSAIVAPSRRLRYCVGVVCACLCAAAVVVGLCLPERFAFGGAVAFLPLCGALSLARLILPARGPRLPGAGRAFPPRRLTDSPALLHQFATVRRIDISGVGQLRLTVQQQWGAGAPASGIAAPGAPMTLLPGATVWPHCMVLRLRAANGAILPLVLLPDAVGAGQYRALAVAVRALANGAATTPIQNRVNLLQGANS